MLGVKSLVNETPVLLFAASSSVYHQFKMLESFSSYRSSRYSHRTTLLPFYRASLIPKVEVYCRCCSESGACVSFPQPLGKKLLTPDISYGCEESVPVPCTNDVDDESPPYVEYLTKSRFASLLVFETDCILTDFSVLQTVFFCRFS